MIIVNYNNLNFLKKCLTSALNSDYPDFEVVLVDNASKDGSLEFIEAEFGSNSLLKVVRNGSNLGFAGGNNSGIAVASGDILVFLNSDTEVEAGWLKALSDVFEFDKTIGACQSKLLLLQDRCKFDNAGGFIDRMGLPIVQGFRETDIGQYDQMFDVFWAKGAAFAVKRSVLSQVGCFDEDFFLEYEETDLCWRIWLRGYRIVFAPKSIVFHHGSASIFCGNKKTNVFVFYLFHRNHLTSLIKNYELIHLLQYLPVLIFLKIMTDLFVFRSERFLRIRAVFYNVRYFRKIWRQRLRVQSFRRESDKRLFRRGIFRKAYLAFYSSS